MVTNTLQPISYIKQLDSLRAIAAILVILWHWIPTDHVINTFDNGAIGVNTFFVLSGFLITRILLNSRDHAIGRQQSKWQLFKNFYFRRALRIFPIYYLTILAIIIFHRYLGAQFSKLELANSLLYTINFYLYALKEWSDMTAHFWSLAVEEQFYLFWPFLIFNAPKRYLVPVIVSCIGIGILSQCLVQDQEFGYLLTHTCLDAFGMGALLAWFTLYQSTAMPRVYKTLAVLAVLCMAILVIQVYTGWLPHMPQRTLHAIIALWLITYILLRGAKKHFAFSFILNNRLLLFLGKISYGIYLYHVPVQWLRSGVGQWVDALLPYGFVRQYHSAITLLINFCLLVGIAWLSWVCIEKPLLKLKTYFDDSRVTSKEVREKALPAA